VTRVFILHSLLAAVALACVLPAYAEKADREKPISFTSDTGEVNYEKKTGVLTGNVVITQGTLTIKANRIDFKQNADNSLSAVATGNPISFRQKRDDTEGYYEGWAQRAEYDGTKEELQLFDNAILKRGTDEIRSNYISYNSATEQFKAEGRAATSPVPPEAASNNRVRGVFQPKEGGPGLPGKSAPPKSAAPLPLQPSGELTPQKK
jgi:lipopolysaccharide export system protein LptA